MRRNVKGFGNVVALTASLLLPPILPPISRTIMHPGVVLPVFTRKENAASLLTKGIKHKVHYEELGKVQPSGLICDTGRARIATFQGSLIAVAKSPTIEVALAAINVGAAGVIVEDLRRHGWHIDYDSQRGEDFLVSKVVAHPEENQTIEEM